MAKTTGKSPKNAVAKAPRAAPKTPRNSPKPPDAVKGTVYVCGPMIGYFNFNFDAFHAASKALRDLGYTVFSPAEHDLEMGLDPTVPLPDDWSLEETMLWDLDAVLKSDYVCLLPGWEYSTGAGIELVVAQATGKGLLGASLVEDGCLIFPYNWENVAEIQANVEAEKNNKNIEVPFVPEISPLAEALNLVHGAGQSTYGHPFDDFSRTGRMWGAILGIDNIDPNLVAMMMVAVKISREVNVHKRDNLVDIAGYAETAYLVEQERVNRNFVSTVFPMLDGAGLDPAPFWHNFNDDDPDDDMGK